MNEGHQGHRNNNADDDNGQVGRVHGVRGFHLSIFLKVDAGRVGRSGDYGAGLHARAIAKKKPGQAGRVELCAPGLFDQVQDGAGFFFQFYPFGGPGD